MPVLLACALFLSWPSPAQEPAPLAELAIVGVTVVDVEAGALRPGRTVVVRGETIAEIGAMGEVAVPAAAERIDGGGLFLIPGLIDSHVHSIASEVEGRLQLAHGITLVRDMGGNTLGMVQLRDARAKGEKLGPEMIVTGAIVDGSPPTWPFSEVCTSPEDGQAAVRKLAAAGVDQIKLYSRLQPEVFRAAAAEAKEQGLLPVGHVPRRVSIEDAAAAGQRTLEHLNGFDALIGRLTDEGFEQSASGHFRYWASFAQLDRELLRPTFEALRASGTTICPTLVVMQGMARAGEDSAAEDPRMKYVPSFLVGFWSGGRYADYGRQVQGYLPGMTAMVEELHRAGVTLIAGTDQANPFVFAGSSLHDELQNLADIGMSPAEALRSTTLTPARVFGLDDRIGSVAAGKAANLVLLRANPLEDIGHAREIEAVLLRGRLFDRAALDALLVEAGRAAGGR